MRKPLLLVGMLVVLGIAALVVLAGRFGIGPQQTAVHVNGGPLSGGLITIGPPSPGVYINKDWNHPLTVSEEHSSTGNWETNPVNKIPVNEGAECSICIYPEPTPTENAYMMYFDMKSYQPYPLLVELRDPAISRIELIGDKRVLVASVFVDADGKSTIAVVGTNSGIYYLAREY